MFYYTIIIKFNYIKFKFFYLLLKINIIFYYIKLFIIVYKYIFIYILVYIARFMLYINK